MKGPLALVALALVGGLAVGCFRSDDFADRFPGEAAIVDNLTAAPKSNPPVYNTYTLEIVGVDDSPVRRYQPAGGEDAYPEVLVKAGTHHFLVDSKPIIRPPNFKTTRLEFTGTVEAGKKYLLTDQGGSVELVAKKDP
jgi:hypothetical protein